MKHLITYIFTSFLITNCYSQNNDTNEIIFKKKDIELHNIYQEYYKDRQDYGHKKDSLLPVFEHKLQEVLNKKDFLGMSFDALTKTKQVSVITSKDKKLHIYSWDTFNMGTRKQYNSLYQYKNNDKIYTGFLSEKDIATGNYINFSDGFHYKIYDLNNNKYLIEGYGTHGSGHEFYTMRLLEMKATSFSDYKAGFDGKDKLAVYKPKGKEKAITYNPDKKEINYLEYTENNNSGFMEPTGKTKTLIYVNGRFIKKQ